MNETATDMDKVLRSLAQLTLAGTQVTRQNGFNLARIWGEFALGPLLLSYLVQCQTNVATKCEKSFC